MTCGYGVQGGVEDALAHSSTAKPQDLKNTILNHRCETEAHVERLQPIFEIIGKRPRTKTCEAIELILEEDDEIAEDYAGGEALDASLLAEGQAVEHYEMSRYGALKTWATQLGMKDAAAPLDPTPREEKKIDALLSELARSQANMKAAYTLTDQGPARSSRPRPWRVSPRIASKWSDCVIVKETSTIWTR